MFLNQETPQKSAFPIEDQELILSEALDLELQIDFFLEAKRAEGLATGSLAYYREKLHRFLDFCLVRAITRVDQIDAKEVRSFMVWLEESGHNAGGRHCFYRTLRTFLYWWHREQDYPSWWRNPFKKAKPPKVPDQALDPISQNDFRLMLEACKGTSRNDVRDRAILHTLLSSGLRASELCRLKLSQVDLTTGIVRVKGGKGKMDRTTIINSAAKKAIRSWLKRRGRHPGSLFETDEGDQMTYWALREMVRRRAKKAGIPEPQRHAFRRAFALAQLQAGVPETMVKRLLGHSEKSNLIHVYAKQVTRHLLEAYADPEEGGW